MASFRRRQATLVVACTVALGLAAIVVNLRAEDGSIAYARASVLLQAQQLTSFQRHRSEVPARLQLLDLVTKMNGYSPNGISYSEGQMPLGLGAASGICDHGYCPQESEEIEINPREVPTSQFAVKWGGFNWENMDDDINVFQPSLCLSRHLADLPEDSCCEQGIEPCDGWGKGPITRDARGTESLQTIRENEIASHERDQQFVFEEEEEAAQVQAESKERDIWGLPVRED